MLLTVFEIHHHQQHVPGPSSPVSQRLTVIERSQSFWCGVSCGKKYPAVSILPLIISLLCDFVWRRGSRQEPVRYGSLPGRDVYLASGAPPPKDAATAGAGGTPRPPPPGDAARAYEAAERVGTVAAYRAFIRRFPGSFEAELAQAQIDKLEMPLKEKPLVVAGGGPVDDEEEVTPPVLSPEEVERGLGLSREERRLVQMGLASAGHDPGPADGMIGRGTRKALRRWQGSRGGRETGYLDADGAKELLGLGERAEAEERARKVLERRRAEREAREAEERRRAEAERRRRVGPPGTKFRDCPECPELVVVPAGTYRMGSERGDSDSDEKPVHEVRIGYPLAVGVYEVTFGEWDACVSGGGCGGYRPGDEGWGLGRRPVINVSWDDAKAYVGWLSRKTGEEYRLLSESEWEYVARAGTRTRYWWGDEIGRNRANCDGCGSRWDEQKTAPVGSFAPNGFGLHDVHGNVWEWVKDCWNESYVGAPTDGSAWESGECGRRVLRGGSWFNSPWSLRSAHRGWDSSGNRSYRYGFRVARTLTP